MITLVLFAFLAGIVTILSPCILPILPIVLSAGVGGSRKKPLGIVTGFIGSFTFFTLTLSSLVRATGLSADLLRSFAVLLIFGFGVSMVIPKFQRLLERIFSSLTRFAPHASDDPGYFGGVLIGTGLGLVWAPCVGPILASVITLAATGSVNWTAALIMLAYSIGTAIPMLIIVYSGRKLLEKAPWLLRNSEKIQRAFGVLMMLTALAIYLNIDRKFQTYILETFPSYGTGLTSFENNPAVKTQLEKLNAEKSERSSMKNVFENFGRAPELIPGGQWFNTTPLTLKELKGKVILIDFWTYTCINCIRTLPFLKAWHEKYKNHSLVIIGIHTPEFEFEKNPGNVQNALEDFGIEYPVMQDNNYATWEAYANRYWPAEYFIDKDGIIRRMHFGEGQYDESEKFIQKLLSETGSEAGDDLVTVKEVSVSTSSPETYLGFRRIDRFASPEELLRNTKRIYSVPTSLPKNSLAYGGEWIVGDEYAMPQENATLSFRFDAKEVYLVMRPRRGASGTLRILIDQKPISPAISHDDVQGAVVTVSQDRLYKLIKLPGKEEHTLTIEFLDDAVEVFAFTFG